MKTNLLKTRWAAIGAAVAVTLGAGGLGISYATNPAGATAFVPITPCRVVDTRPAPDTVGARTSPLGPEETFTVNAHGNNGNCTGIPAGATGLSLNVTALGATTGTFLTLWATGATQPTASNLNPQPGQPPTPNAVTTGLSAGGQFNIFNKVGSVNVIVDIVGYYTDHQHTGADIVDNSLTAVDTQNEPGIASDFMSSVVSATSTPTAIAGTSIRVPSDGFVNIEVTGHWTNADAGSDEVFCQLQLGAVGAVDTSQPWFGLRDRGAATDYTSFSAHRIMPINVADNPLLFTFGQSISLVCDEQSGNVSFDDVFVSATFFPTSYEPIGFIFVPFEAGADAEAGQASD